MKAFQWAAQKVHAKVADLAYHWVEQWVGQKAAQWEQEWDL